MSEEKPLAHPRDSEIDLTERVAKRLFTWANWYIAAMSSLGVVLFLILSTFGWTKFSDFKASINEFNQSVKPQIQQAKQDAQDASKDATAARKQIAETVAEANKQLESVRNVNSKIAILNRQILELGQTVEDLKHRLPTSQPAQAGRDPISTLHPTILSAPAIFHDGQITGKDFGAVQKDIYFTIRARGWPEQDSPSMLLGGLNYSAYPLLDRKMVKRWSNTSIELAYPIGYWDGLMSQIENFRKGKNARVPTRDELEIGYQVKLSEDGPQSAYFYVP